ncbi:hypothetical protein ACK3TF_002238 [Chlorella vulgaris]
MRPVHTAGRQSGEEGPETGASIAQTDSTKRRERCERHAHGIHAPPAVVHRRNNCQADGIPHAAVDARTVPFGSSSNAPATAAAGAEGLKVLCCTAGGSGGGKEARAVPHGEVGKQLGGRERRVVPAKPWQQRNQQRRRQLHNIEEAGKGGIAVEHGGPDRGVGSIARRRRHRLLQVARQRHSPAPRAQHQRLLINISLQRQAAQAFMKATQRRRQLRYIARRRLPSRPQQQAQSVVGRIWTAVQQRTRDGYPRHGSRGQQKLQFPPGVTGGRPASAQPGSPANLRVASLGAWPKFTTLAVMRTSSVIGRGALKQPQQAPKYKFGFGGVTVSPQCSQFCCSRSSWRCGPSPASIAASRSSMYSPNSVGLRGQPCFRPASSRLRTSSCGAAARQQAREAQLELQLQGQYDALRLKMQRSAELSQQLRAAAAALEAAEARAAAAARELEQVQADREEEARRAKEHLRTAGARYEAEAATTRMLQQQLNDAVAQAERNEAEKRAVESKLAATERRLVPADTAAKTAAEAAKSGGGGGDAVLIKSLRSQLREHEGLVAEARRLKEHATCCRSALIESVEQCMMWHCGRVHMSPIVTYFQPERQRRHWHKNGGKKKGGQKAPRLASVHPTGRHRMQRRPAQTDSAEQRTMWQASATAQTLAQEKVEAPTAKAGGPDGQGWKGAAATQPAALNSRREAGQPASRHKSFMERPQGRQKAHKATSAERAGHRRHRGQGIVGMSESSAERGTRAAAGAATRGKRRRKGMQVPSDAAQSGEKGQVGSSGGQEGPKRAAGRPKGQGRPRGQGRRRQGRPKAKAGPGGQGVRRGAPKVASQGGGGGRKGHVGAQEGSRAAKGRRGCLKGQEEGRKARGGSDGSGGRRAKQEAVRAARSPRGNGIIHWKAAVPTRGSDAIARNPPCYNEPPAQARGAVAAGAIAIVKELAQGGHASSREVDEVVINASGEVGGAEVQVAPQRRRPAPRAQHQRLLSNISHRRQAAQAAMQATQRRRQLRYGARRRLPSRPQQQAHRYQHNGAAEHARWPPTARQQGPAATAVPTRRDGR